MGFLDKLFGRGKKPDEEAGEVAQPASEPSGSSEEPAGNGGYAASEPPAADDTGSES